MVFSLDAFFYQIFIDPILAGLRRAVLAHVEPSHRILDVACGTGALALAMACKAGHVTGIDLSKENIAAAKQTARRRGADNVIFELRDAGDLSCYARNEFDIAVTSMAVHQFDADLAVKILAEMRRIARTLILADYNHHMPRGWGRSVAWGIERLAGGDHFRNFRTYMQRGGIHHFARQAGIILVSEVIRGGGVFVVAVSEGTEISLVNH
jgi:2-polyprenyl-3-methyl-5-hydroxy-6-metoxy-1,4-benzoquinol methylase